jgi:ATP-dependent helicase/nuclease subunit A
MICAILADPAYAELFGPDSLGEAPIAAALPDGQVIAGTVDRLLVTPDGISVIDFKTGRVAGSANEVPAYHRAQMEAYVEALRVIFPNRTIRAALLYTAGPQLIELAG